MRGDVARDGRDNPGRPQAYPCTPGNTVRRGLGRCVLASWVSREWRNRQTRTVQVRVPDRVWGFNSPLAHRADGELPGIPDALTIEAYGCFLPCAVTSLTRSLAGRCGRPPCLRRTAIHLLRTAGALAAPILLLVGLPAVPAAAAVQTSTGVRCTIVGTPSDDVLRGTRHRDVICGRGGRDVIRGGRGNDLIDAGRAMIGCTAARATIGCSPAPAPTR